ncbi:MAG: polysaccharide deacetylase family protein, partial [Clostridia bacterium]|nr:polysaccharide deacetylase family protein [Clostridia bacterium]
MKEKGKKGIVNDVLGAIIVFVGAVCLYPTETETVDSSTPQPYRSGRSENGVSLTFNVYEGREVVFGILDTLETFGAKCTFYIGGCWADDNADCVKEIFSRGHEIGNHGYFHKNHAQLSREENEREIAVCNHFLKLCTGVS